MLVHVNANARSFSHANTGAAVAGDDSAKELKEIRIVAHEEHFLTVGILADELLEVGISGVGFERRADFNLAFVSEFVADKLCGLQSALERARNNYVWLDFESAEEASHHHALFLAFGNETALGVEFCALARNTSVRVAHEVEIHEWGTGVVRGEIPAKSAA